MILETPRLLLREFVEADWPAVYAYQSDPLYWRYYPWTERSETAVQEQVRMFISWQAHRPRTRFQLAAVLKSEGRLIGNAGIRIDLPKGDERRSANIGYEVDSRYWGQGYASEAARAIVAFGFEELGLQRIWAQCVAENLASARVLEKASLVLESRQPETEFIRDRWHDRLVYGISDQDWRGNRVQAETWDGGSRKPG